jgi:redox-sensitive bicupin YhaK (pirin superfamily)
MGVIRKVAEVLTGVPTIEGAGVHLRRAFGNREAVRTDPFLMLDDFRSNSPADYLPGFPWHPHRGIETITYMLAGSVIHSDSMGNRGVIPSGEVQWMTAGSGVVHQEMPRGDRSGRLGGVQLWANLPARCKMRSPRYVAIAGDEMPVVALPGGGEVRIIAGRLGEVEGPVRDLVTSPTYLDVTLPAGASLELPVSDGHTAIVYVLTGTVQPAPGDALMAAYQAALLDRGGDTLALTASSDGARMLVFTGEPLEEPIAWHGPIVMNTRDELNTALRELQEGTFIKDYATDRASGGYQ